MQSREEKIARAKKMGIPMPITDSGVLNEGGVSSVPVTSKNAAAHERIAAIRRGANRGDFSKMINSTKKGGFEAIPEPKMRKNPNHPANQLSDKKYSVNPDSGAPAANIPHNSELAAISNMFEGGSSSYNMPSFNPEAKLSNNQQPDLSIQSDGYGPEFNPTRMISEKRAKMQQSEYLKYAVNNEAEQLASSIEGSVDTSSFDLNSMKKMMENIAKETMNEMLDSYIKKEGKKTFFENTNVKSNDNNKIIKTSEGKYFKLVPVTIKKK